MKRAVIFEAGKAGLVDAPIPQPKKDWALVKILATPMCTEYKRFINGPGAEFMGHEAMGEVVEVAQPTSVKVGDRVVVMPQYPCGVCALCVAGDYIHCENSIDFVGFTGSQEGSATYAQYMLKPAWLLPKIPDEVSDEMASLALCALGPSFGAFDSMQLTAYDTVLITGAGPVGLGAIVNARYRGARVIVMEGNEWRAERARLLGAEWVLKPGDPQNMDTLHEFTDGTGVDQALDCSGVPCAQRFCIDAVRRKGKVAFVGESMQDLTIRISPDLIRKGINLTGAWHYNLSLFPKVMQVIQRSPVIKNLISHVLPMSQVQNALQISASQQCAKIILKPWE
jgi:L-iditol 2-dehydrogenase